MAGEKQINLRFRVTDDGTVVLDKIGQSIQKVDANVKSMSGSLSLIKWDAIVNLGQRAIGAGEQVYSFARSIASSANDIQRQAQIMGLSIENYQKLAYAARMADVDTEQFGTGMKFLSRSIEEAKAGTGNAGQYFRALGIDVNKLSEGELTLENMTYLLSDSFRGLSDGTVKVDTAIALLGRSGQAMVPFLNLGAQGIKNFGEEAVKLGTILGDVVVKKGSEAEMAFKRLEARVNSLKVSLAPGAADIAKLIENVLTVDPESTKAYARMAKEWDDYNKGIVTSARNTFETLPDLYDTFGYEFDKFAGTIKAVDERLLVELKRAPEGAKQAQLLMHDWLSGLREDLATGITYYDQTIVKIDELNAAMATLGTKSTAGLVTGIKDSEAAFAAIKAQFAAGKVSVLDYANAIQSLTKAYQGLTGGDVTKQLVDLELKTSEAMAAVNKNLPDWKKEMGKITDAWLEERNKIQEKSPAYIRANLSKWEQDLQEAIRLANQYMASIQPANLKIQGASGGATASASNLYASNVGMVTGAFADQNFDVKLKFWGEASPKKPLNETIQDIIDQFGGLDKAMQMLQMSIDFTEMTQQMKTYQKQLDKVSDWYHFYEAIRSEFPTVSLNTGGENPWLDRNVTAQLEQWKSDALAGISILNMKGMLNLLQAFSGSFQFGTTYVPKTGLAYVHEGERIIPRNVSNSSSVVNNFSISGGDAKRIADEIAKVLKYQRSGELKSALR